MLRQLTDHAQQWVGRVSRAHLPLAACLPTNPIGSITCFLYSSRSSAYGSNADVATTNLEQPACGSATETSSTQPRGQQQQQHSHEQQQQHSELNATASPAQQCRCTRMQHISSHQEHLIWQLLSPHQQLVHRIHTLTTGDASHQWQQEAGAASQLHGQPQLQTQKEHCRSQQFGWLAGLNSSWRRQQQQHMFQLFRAYSIDTKPWRAQQQQQQQSGSSSSKGSPSKKPQMRRNHQITARTLQVVFPDGTNQVLGLADARAAAEGLGLDLVEVNARSDPPVARILDYSKMVYEQQQKAEAADKQRRLQQKLSTPKEMQFSARIADHDLEVKMRKVTEWLETGHRVQLVVKHRSEELEAATDALSYLTTRLQSEFKVEVGSIQPQRRAVAALIKPLGGQASKQQ